MKSGIKPKEFLDNMKIKKSLEEREAFVAQEIAKRTAQQTPQSTPETVKRSPADASRENLIKARRYRHTRDPWAPKPLTSTERSRRRRAKP